MPTWTGWQNQFLNRAGIIVTPPNRQLLTSWAANAHTSCANNPIDLSHKLTGTSDCAKLPGIFPQAQRYTSHAQAATAFRDEIRQSFAGVLLRAMNTGNPYQVPYANDVASVFVSWGTDKMLNVYLAGEPGTGGAGGGGGGGGAGAGDGASVHKGWHDLRTTVNHKMPGHVASSHKMTQAALRKLSHIRRVRI